MRAKTQRGRRRQVKYRSLLKNIGLFCSALLQKSPMFLGSLLMRAKTQSGRRRPDIPS